MLKCVMNAQIHPNPVGWFSDCTLQKCHSKESSTAELCDGLRKNFVGTDQGQSRFGNICVHCLPLSPLAKLELWE